MNYSGEAYPKGAILERGLESLLQKLSGSQLKVAVVGDVPTFGQFPELCLYSRDHDSLDSSCQISREEAEGQELLYKPTIERVLAKYPEVSYVSLLNSLCDESLQPKQW